MKILAKLALTLTLLFGTAQLISAQTSRCIPGLGGRFFTSSGIVQVEILQGDADYKSEIDLFMPKPITEIGFNQQTGQVVTLGAFPGGTELVFGILVYNTGFTFRMGLGSRNPDGVPHAIVQCLGDGVAKVSFEDTVNGDFDYNDVVIQINANPIPARTPPTKRLVFTGGVARFGAGENNPAPGFFGLFVYPWRALVNVDYQYYFDPDRRGYVVFIKRIDQSVLMENANRPNHPCDIQLKISTDVYENDGQNYVGTIRVAQPGSYVYPQNALSWGGISYPSLLVFSPKLTIHATAISTDCLGGDSIVESFNLPF